MNEAPPTQPWYSKTLAEQQPVGRWAAIRGSTGCINIQKHNYIAN